MARQELSLGFRTESNERELQAVAEAAGKYGFDVMSVYEDLGDRSPMYPLFTLAKHAPRVKRFGPAGIVVARHPQTMDSVVGEVSRLDDISNGRAYLGLVPGAWMDTIGMRPASVQQMREAAQVSRYLLERRDDGFIGGFYNVKPGFTVNYQTPAERVPLLIGAWGPHMAALAGEIADEIKVGGSANPAMVPIIKDRVAVGAQRAGRNVDDVGVVLGAVTVIDEDRNRAMHEARRRAAIYIEAIGDKDPTAMADFGDEITAIQAAVRQRDIETAVRNLPDDLARRFIIAGNPNDIILHTEQMFAAGASRVEFGTPHGIDEIEGIRLLGEQVLPYFAGR